MRLVCKIKSQEEALDFSYFLTKEGIDNDCESLAPDQDGHSIWVYNEDKTELALKWYDLFKENPKDPQFSSGQYKKPPKILPKKDPIKKAFPSFSMKLTTTIIAICIGLFLWGQYLMLPISTSTPALSRLFSPIRKGLLYDYPKSLQLLNQIVDTYGPESFENPEELPPDGQFLVNKYHETAFWPGIYNLMLIKITQPNEKINENWTLFSKIRQGEVWRFFSPCLLHSDIFHIFFNMIWLVVLGYQMEQRIGKLRYLLFILIVAALSNTLQYLMSGPIFLGFSAVICGMLTFIWVRQKIAPWEGYTLQRSTIMFISFFIVAIFMLQMLSFLSEVLDLPSFSANIANTAHLSGALVGAILGRMKLFVLK